MPQRRKKDPSYRLHKPSGQAIVTLPDGFRGRHDVYLGKFDTAESWEEYNRVLSEWKVNGRRLPTTVAPTPELTIHQLIFAYYRFAESYYVKDGKPTSEVNTIAQAMRFLKRLYGDTAAKDFGPLALKAVRQEMIRHPITRTVKVRDPITGEEKEEVKLLRQGMARKNINKQVGCIKRMFAWAVEEELVPVHVYQALTCIKGLKKGKGQAREKPRVKPVPEAHIEATLPHLPPVVRIMVQVQRLCGGRPQDIVQMRPIDIDMSGPVWEYRPPCYKTQHRNEEDGPDRERIVFLGPKAQALLKLLLPLCVTDHFFGPRRSEVKRLEVRREARKTPLWPSHVREQERQRATARKREAPPRDHYDVASYRRAVRRACVKAGVPIWCPLQLRHCRGTEVRKRFGLEASQAVLGHAELGVTQVYAEVDRETARRVMAAIG
jgi:integrase